MRSIAPDANPYMAIYAILKTGLDGTIGPNMRYQAVFLPDNIYDAIEPFRASAFAAELLGPEVRDKYVEAKLASADRCPRLLGTFVKTQEVQYHHEVYNQFLWNEF